ncbi:hypothetical protein D3C77_300680 [compost metagenome]
MHRKNRDQNNKQQHNKLGVVILETAYAFRLADIHNEAKRQQGRQNDQAELRPVIHFILKQTVLFKQGIHFRGNFFPFLNEYIPLFDKHRWRIFTRFNLRRLRRFLIIKFVGGNRQARQFLDDFPGYALAERARAYLLGNFGASRLSINNLICRQPRDNISGYRLHFINIFRSKPRNFNKSLLRNLVSLLTDPLVYFFKQLGRIIRGVPVIADKVLNMVFRPLGKLLTINFNFVIRRYLIILIKPENPVKHLPDQYFVAQRQNRIYLPDFLCGFLLGLERCFRIRDIHRGQNLFIAWHSDGNIIGFRQQFRSQTYIEHNNKQRKQNITQRYAMSPSGCSGLQCFTFLHLVRGHSDSPPEKFKARQPFINIERMCRQQAFRIGECWCFAVRELNRRQFPRLRAGSLTLIFSSTVISNYYFLYKRMTHNI